MKYVTLGNTGIKVSRLGIGGAEFHRHEEQNTDLVVGKVLNIALDEGINFLDTAACYARNEVLIGKTVSHRRDEYVLATKCGHNSGLGELKDWDPSTIEASVERSLKRLKTNHVDVLQLHSCGLSELEAGYAIETVKRIQEKGKTRFIGYSGDNEPAMWAVQSEAFDTLQISVSVADQRARSMGILALAKRSGMGVIAKRPVANGAWRSKVVPNDYAIDYWNRSQLIQKLGDIPGEPDIPFVTALGFVLSHSEIDSVIVGTHNREHVTSNVALINQGLVLSDVTVQELQSRFDKLDDNWLGLT